MRGILILKEVLTDFDCQTCLVVALGQVILLRHPTTSLIHAIQYEMPRLGNYYMSSAVFVIFSVYNRENNTLLTVIVISTNRHRASSD